jgi:hypothetical protein
LDNIEHDCAPNPSECDDVVARYVLAAGTNFRFDRAALIATVKDATYVESMRARGAVLVARPLAADLWLVLAQTMENGSTAFLPKSAVQGLLATEDELVAQATARVDAICTGLDVVEVDDGIYAADGNDPLPCLLAVRRWKTVATKLGAELLVTVPSARGIFVASSARPASVAKLAALTSEAYDRASHPVSKSVLRWTPSGWVAHATDPGRAR